MAVGGADLPHLLKAATRIPTMTPSVHEYIPIFSSSRICTTAEIFRLTAFSLVPNPNQGRFAHYWRTGNDISARWSVILNRIDINNKWAPFAGPGHFNDPVSEGSRENGGRRGVGG